MVSITPSNGHKQTALLCLFKVTTLLRTLYVKYFDICSNLLKVQKDISEKKQICGYCPEDTCLLNCEICNPKKEGSTKCECEEK